MSKEERRKVVEAIEARLLSIEDPQRKTRGKIALYKVKKMLDLLD